MAPLNLTVRTGPRQSFPLEIEDDETVEALAVAIYSLNPDLGEELRLAHKGKPLKDEQELKEAGVKSGDVIAVAKKVLRAPPAGASPAVAGAVTSGPAMTSPPVKEVQSATSESPAKDLQEPGTAGEPAAPQAAKSDAPAVPPALFAGKDEPLSADEPAAPSAAECAVPAVPLPSSAGDATDPAVPQDAAQAVTPAAAPASPVPKNSHLGEAASAAMPAAMDVTAEAPAEPKQGEVGQDAAPEAHVDEAPAAEAPAAAPVAEASVSEEAAPASPSTRQEPEEEFSADALFAAASRLEAGDADAHPAELVALLRRAGQRLQVCESTIAEAGHALQLLNHFSAHSLRSLNNSMQGLPMPSQEPQEGTKSFLIKKGDADVQEAHRQASLMRPSTAGGSANSHSGGVLSTSSTPMTKEEMDRARKARLEKLEQQQADKKKAQEEAAARAKAKEAMFEKPFAGTAKPLGKF